MTNDELDRILSHADDIVPSSGFTASVMEAVHREVFAPPPIPFPWKRAIPLVFAGVVAVVLLIFGIGAQLSRGTPELSPALRSTLTIGMTAASKFGAGWIACALLAAFVSVKLSMRLVLDKN